MLEPTGGQARLPAGGEAAIKRTAANDMQSMAAGKMGLSTSQVGDKVAQYAGGIDLIKNRGQLLA